MNKGGFSSGKLIILIIIMIGVTLFSGCLTQPQKEYTYITLSPLSGWEKEKKLSFKLDLTDTAAVYEIYFTAQIKNNQNINECNGFPVEICFTSPKGVNYHNSVSLPINVIQKQELYKLSHGIIEIEWPYIKNIKNKEGGIWHLSLQQTAPQNIYKNIIGFGVRCKKTEKESSSNSHNL